MVINESINSFFNMILLHLAFEPAQHNSNNRGSKILGYAALPTVGALGDPPYICFTLDHQFQ
jgi:hypothetical protein